MHQLREAWLQEWGRTENQAPSQGQRQWLWASGGRAGLTVVGPKQRAHHVLALPVSFLSICTTAALGKDDVKCNSWFQGHGHIC